jgi:hypothetical protein
MAGSAIRGASNVLLGEAMLLLGPLVARASREPHRTASAMVNVALFAPGEAADDHATPSGGLLRVEVAIGPMEAPQGVVQPTKPPSADAPAPKELV